MTICKKFKDIPVGAQFFDTYSGEDFTKVSAAMAAFLTGGDAFEGEEVLFEPDEEVETATLECRSPGNPAENQSRARSLLEDSGETKMSMNTLGYCRKIAAEATQEELALALYHLYCLSGSRNSFDGSVVFCPPPRLPGVEAMHTAAAEFVEKTISARMK